MLSRHKIALIFDKEPSALNLNAEQKQNRLNTGQQPKRFGLRTLNKHAIAKRSDMNQSARGYYRLNLLNSLKNTMKKWIKSLLFSQSA